MDAASGASARSDTAHESMLKTWQEMPKSAYRAATMRRKRK
jgi:hypothetical protein